MLFILIKILFLLALFLIVRVTEIENKSDTNALAYSEIEETLKVSLDQELSRENLLELEKVLAETVF